MEKLSGALNMYRQAKIKKRIKLLMLFRLRSHSLGVCFGQVKTEEKSNEITAISELPDLLELKGMIVTIDAMGCQKKIVEKIAEKEAEYVISLKGNQQSIHRDVKEFLSTLVMTLIVSVIIFRMKNIPLKLDTGELKNAPVIFAAIVIGFQEKMNGRISMELECSCAKER